MRRSGAKPRRVAVEALTEQVRAALERCVFGGGVALFPADGLYGLACDPTRADAIERIHRIKGRDDGKPSAVMYFSPLAMRELVAASVRGRAMRSERYSPGRSPWSSRTPSTATPSPVARIPGASACV